MKKGNKYIKLYVFSITFLIIGCFISCFFGAKIYINLSSRSSSETSKSADGFTIDSYKVVLNVSKNNTIDVKEYITVYFYEKGHHGIYRFIPEWLEYTSKDNKTMSRKAELSQLSSYYEDYSISTIKGKKRIKIGDAYTTLPIGEHKYVIAYTYDMGSDPYENFDELIFHAFGDYWGTKINNASIEIHMPKAIKENSNIHFFADKYRKNDITSYVNYDTQDNTIYAELSSNYPLTKSLTVDLVLPDGYFDRNTSYYGSLSLIFCIICIIFALITFMLWIKNGKDLDKVPETVEFYPPDHLDAAQIGYLYKKETGRNLSIALIVELASKGFIKIEESEDKTKQTIIANKNCNLSDLTENEKLVYNQLFKSDNETVLADNHTFYEVFAKVSENVRNEFDDKINDLKAYKCMLFSSFGFVICSLLWGLAYCVIEDLNPKFSYLYYISAISNVIILLFSILMKRKNSYGEQIQSRIKGFRNYIEVAEKNQIEMLAEKNPNYFYDILPYSYVLGVSSKWIKKFESIPVPVNDMGNFNYYDSTSLYDLANSVYYPSSSSSSSGCSSCGGGCSSCGGGCSSCGGGGSW